MAKNVCSFWRFTIRGGLLRATSMLCSTCLGAYWRGLMRRAALLSLILAGATAEGAEPPAKGELWRGVTRVRGRASIEYRYGQNDHDPIRHTSIDGLTQVQVDFTLERERRKAPEPPPLPAGASPQAVEMMRALIASLPDDEATTSFISWRTDSAKITGTTFETKVYSYPWHNGRHTTRGEFSGQPLFEFHLGLTIESGVWQLGTPAKLREKYRRVTSGLENDTAQNTTRVIDEVSEIDGVENSTFNGTLAGKPGPVHGTSKVEWGPSAGGSPTFKAVQIGRLEFWPEYVDAPEVEVTIEGYAKWRPEGSIGQPTQPGNQLIARATLVPKGSARVEDLPRIKTFRFELLDTSSEPGVCLNWPLGAKDTDYDLRLAAAPKFTGQLSEKGQANAVALTLNDDKGRPYAETQIDSYDFGGRATLKVVCELQDGREITGLMKGEKEGAALVRLPKMNGPDWIAEAWRKEKKVEKLSALADDEKVEGQQHNGDGYTLYEEYRGWVVNGKHTEGDPERKDFFVLNLFAAKADAQNGINLFEALSKLRVHSKLRRTEMGETARLMNGNHRDAPHRVDQHGVWVKTFTRAKLGDNGADTPMMKAGVAGRPGITKGVGILARGDSESIFNQPFNLPARDTIMAYDRAIAHELLHSVGVEHHGAGDYAADLTFIPPNHRNNILGRPYYSANWSGGKPVQLFNEAGDDVAAKDYVRYAEILQYLRSVIGDQLLAEAHKLVVAGRNNLPWMDTPEKKAEADLADMAAPYITQKGIIGIDHGAHSGDQDCVMRYYFANFYEATGRKDALYVVTPGTERIGIDICHAGTGTGINAAGHRPQSRYGNAAAGEGDCFSQICPNDAIPPRKTR